MVRHRVRSLVCLLVALFAPSLAWAALSLDPSPGLRLAYIDPGAGSFVIQALVAAAAGIAVTLRLYWQRIKGFFGSSAGADRDDDAPEDGA